MVDIVENENIMSHIEEFDGVIVGTNCYQVMRNGFQHEITEAYPYIKLVNYGTAYGDPEKLGTIVEGELESNKLFILAFISFGYNFKGGEKCYIDYDALRRTIKLINIKYSKKHFATTWLGSSEFDGNGDKDTILSIINEELKNVDLTIFDYKQTSGPELKQKEYRNKYKI